jgi:hypothetical protein
LKKRRRAFEEKPAGYFKTCGLRLDWTTLNSLSQKGQKVDVSEKRNRQLVEREQAENRKLLR